MGPRGNVPKCGGPSHFVGGLVFPDKPLVIVFILLKRFPWFYSRILVLWRGSSILTIYILYICCSQSPAASLLCRDLAHVVDLYSYLPPTNPFRPCACRLAVARCLGGVDRRHAPPTPSVAWTVMFGYPLPKFLLDFSQRSLRSVDNCPLGILLLFTSRRPACLCNRALCV